MTNLEKSKKSIIQVLFWFNLIFLIVSIFYFTKGLTLTITITNFILIGTLFVIDKFGVLFEGIFSTNKMFKGLNSVLKEE